MTERKKSSLWLLIPVWAIATVAVLFTLLVVYALTLDLWTDPVHSPSPAQAKQVQP